MAARAEKCIAGLAVTSCCYCIAAFVLTWPNWRITPSRLSLQFARSFLLPGCAVAVISADEGCCWLRVRDIYGRVDSLCPRCKYDKRGDMMCRELDCVSVRVGDGLFSLRETIPSPANCTLQDCTVCEEREDSCNLSNTPVISCCLLF